MFIYNLIEFSDIYSKASRGLWLYYRDQPALDNNKNTIDFLADNDNSILFKFKQQITGQAENCSTKNIEVIVPLKYLSNFWRTFEMLLINCEINLQSKWSEKCFLVAGTAVN